MKTNRSVIIVRPTRRAKPVEVIVERKSARQIADRLVRKHGMAVLDIKNK